MIKFLTTHSPKATVVVYVMRATESYYDFKKTFSVAQRILTIRNLATGLYWLPFVINYSKLSCTESLRDKKYHIARSSMYLATNILTLVWESYQVLSCLKLLPKHRSTTIVYNAISLMNVSVHALSLFGMYKGYDGLKESWLRGVVQSLHIIAEPVTAHLIKQFPLPISTSTIQAAAKMFGSAGAIFCEVLKLTTK